MVIFLVIVVVFLGGAYAAFMLWIVPPDIDPIDPPRRHPEGINHANNEEEPSDEVSHGWRDGVFTILLAGEDDEFGGTDVVMLILFDTENRTMDVLSIPRDTVVNVPWGIKKINSVKNLYTRLDGDYDHYMEALTDEVAKLVGYRANNWVTLDLRGFIALVDALPDGGVYFNVPVRMWYEDPCQDLFINLQPGYQRLNGYQAMQLVRYRSYVEGDIQRIRVQHDFLQALADQLLQARTLLVVDDLVRIFMANVETDLSAANMGWFAREFLYLDQEDIRFHSVDSSIANINDSVNGISYVTLYVEPWVALVNQYFNPFTWRIEAEDLEILTRDATGAFFTTSGTPHLNWGR
ncbi:MAG: LCP family protein [Oscillospiraceae bacterium]|nr:LCP family protein [Oscillospiraceae bacterium]